MLGVESVMPSNRLILCCPLLLLPSIFPSIRVFFSESVFCIRWPKYWSFNFSISPSSEYSGLISFRIDWFDFLTASGTLNSLLQHHSSKASILWHLAFFIVYFMSLYVLYSLGYDKPRQHIKKQRHYFANKSLSSQTYGFCSSHVWM